MDYIFENILVLATVIDLIAVAGLALLVLRTSRQRKDAAEDQRATLETLRGDLAQLIADAESRTRTIDKVLAAREKRLRALLADVERFDGPPRAAERGRTAPPFERGRQPLDPADILEEGADVRPGREAADPAEARLLRDLDVRLGARIA
jgi:hypothetical protein